MSSVQGHSNNHRVWVRVRVRVRVQAQVRVQMQVLAQAPLMMEGGQESVHAPASVRVRAGAQV